MHQVHSYIQKKLQLLSNSKEDYKKNINKSKI